MGMKSEEAWSLRPEEREVESSEFRVRSSKFRTPENRDREEFVTDVWVVSIE
jgi:hypothetical protein